MDSRVHLQPFTAADVEQLLGVFRDPAVRRHLLDDIVVSEEWVRNEVAASEQRFAATGAGVWSIRLAGSSRIIGFVGFREFFDPPQLQLLYGLLPEFWKQGLATEAATLACGHAFDTLGFAEIIAATDGANEDSVKVLRRLGMSLVRTSSDWPSGTVFYRISREAWCQRT